MTRLKELFKNLTNFSFGGTSAITTNMSLIVGLGATDAARGAIIGSLLVIAVADNISDSLGVHIYKESESCSFRESLRATLMNFTTRLVISLTFILVVLFFPRVQAEIIATVWGLALLAAISYLIAKRNPEARPVPEILKHVGVAVLVIVASRYAGGWIHSHFNRG